LKSERECLLEPVTSDAIQRKNIVNFIVNFEDEKHDVNFWQKRTAMWWEDNPFYDENLPRGWILKAQEGIVGFLGVIVTDYLYGDKRYKALNITTWRVLKEYRNQSMRLFHRFYSYKDRHILFNTTSDNKAVQRIFQAFGFKANTKISNFIFPIRCNLSLNISNIALFFLQRLYSLLLPRADCRAISGGGGVKLIKMPDKYKKFLIKNKDGNYLSWYSSSPLSKKIVGYFNDNNELSSFVTIEEAMARFKSLRIIDYFIGDDSGKEILSIINYICNNPCIISNAYNYRFLILSIFSGNEITIKRPFFIPNKKSHAKHYYSLPEELKDARILNYLAEGDVAM